MGGGEKGGNGAGTIKNSKEPKSRIKLRLPPRKETLEAQ